MSQAPTTSADGIPARAGKWSVWPALPKPTRAILYRDIVRIEM
jgi:hypothetical protein